MNTQGPRADKVRGLFHALADAPPAEDQSPVFTGLTPPQPHFLRNFHGISKAIFNAVNMHNHSVFTSDYRILRASTSGLGITRIQCQKLASFGPCFSGRFTTTDGRERCGYFGIHTGLTPKGA